MNSLIKIAQSATPETATQFRQNTYGGTGIREFLRDVIAMANAAVDGPRYIVTGVDFDKQGRRKIHGVSRNDFAGKPSYQSLVADFVEPPIRIKYQPVSLEGKHVGVFEIGDCQDKPYMMRIDQSEMLRRGDAYVRVRNAAVKMGRRQLQDMFERKFRHSVSADRIEIGFPGEIIHKDLRLGTTDLSQRPSALASSKLKQMAELHTQSTKSGSTTVMVRLTHARLFGSDNPYEIRSASDLLAEMEQIEKRHADDDAHFLYETHCNNVQLVVLNQGDGAISDASLTLVLPNHNSFYVASQLPKTLHNGVYSDRSHSDLSEYPTVALKDDAIHITSNLGEIPVGDLVDAFETPLRVCVGSELKGRRIGIRYSLFGSNLRAPATGKLRLLC